MFQIQACWAGYIILQSKVDSEEALEVHLSELEAHFFEGMEYTVHGSTMPLKVLTVDVMCRGNIFRQVDFKK